MEDTQSLYMELTLKVADPHSHFIISCYCPETSLLIGIKAVVNVHVGADSVVTSAAFTDDPRFVVEAFLQRQKEVDLKVWRIQKPELWSCLWSPTIRDRRGSFIPSASSYWSLETGSVCTSVWTHLTEEHEDSFILLQQLSDAACRVQGVCCGLKQKLPHQRPLPLQRPHIDLKLVKGKVTLLPILAHTLLPRLRQLWTHRGQTDTHTHTQIT